MRAATHRFAVAVEDRGHFAAATRLADRVLVDALPWCDGILDTMRRWGTGPDERPWHSLTKSYRAARERGLKTWGHFDGEPGLSDAPMVRAQLLIFQADQVEGEQIDAVVLARDLDDDPERALGFQQVLTQRWPFPVLVALCRPEVEAWYVAGFEPENNDERARLARECKTLDFSPPLKPHCLTAKRKQDPKDAKAILGRLCGEDHVRKERCLDAPLNVLQERGLVCGLADYLAAVRADLVPVLAQA